ncbi:Uncharacterized protein OBRU01_13879 [Operophtera brumata]|uniref:Uncharacterized protein n=1 Tax=Operophtera brumata TaxID=104452 RepID=A0A0L7L7P7_OPEBR|nr:Uncharacterized protein OBRU01_13879 [Operophtera brumata]
MNKSYDATPSAHALSTTIDVSGRDLNYMATPIEFFRRRSMRRNTLERVMDQLDRQRFGRPDPRPDTPNVAEINIDDLDFVRLNANDTYTLNGRTIRLLGANFENYPVMPDGSVRPPSYTEAVRYKLYGPPPEYLSREGLNRRSADTVDQEATNNVEMPPCYEDLNAISDNNGNVNVNDGAVTVNNGNVNDGTDTVNNGNVIVIDGTVTVNNDNRLNAATNAIVGANSMKNELGSSQNDDTNVETLSSIIDNLPAIDSDVNANESDMVVNDNGSVNNDVTNCLVNNGSVNNDVTNFLVNDGSVNNDVTNCFVNNGNFVTSSANNNATHRSANIVNSFVSNDVVNNGSINNNVICNNK